MTAWISALCLLGLLDGGTRQEEILWARSWEAAFQEAKTLNVPVLVAVAKDGCPASDGLVRQTFHDPRLVAYLNDRAVPLVGHTADKGIAHEQQQEEDPETGKTILRCPIYKGISCTEHNYIYSKVQDLLGVDQTPKLFVLGPEGKPLHGSGEVMEKGATEIVVALMRAQKKMGKPLSRSAYSDARETLDAGRAAFTAEEFPRAIRLFQGLSRNAKAPPGTREEAESALSKVNEAGFVRLGQAKEALEKDRDEGRRLLKGIARDFRGLQAAKAAKEVLRETRKRGRSERGGS